MGLVFYFLLTIIETIVLLTHTLRVTSAPVEALLLGYSKERLALIIAIIVLLVMLALRLARAVRRNQGEKPEFARWLQVESAVWVGIFASLLWALALFLVLVQEPPFFEHFYPIYSRARPVFYWAFLICVQTIFFLLTWHGARFTRANKRKDPNRDKSSIVILIAIFLCMIIIKLLFVFPHGYGLIKRFGESKYILMAQIFTEGVTLAGYNNPAIFHYPFLYPITLSFPWQVENHAFSAMKLMNVLFAASAVIPIYLIARQLIGRKSSLLVAFLSGLLPFQFLLPAQILSENLYIPLFLWSAFLIFSAPRNERYRLPWDILTGVFIGLLYLTRYITLAIIPFFLLLWWIKPFGKTKKILRFPLRKVLHLMIIILLIITVYFPWVVFGREAGLTLREALGFGITASTTPEQLTFGNLLKWIVLYLAYFILMLSPFLGLLFFIRRQHRRSSQVRRWLIVLLLISLAFMVAVVRHSWRAAYNADLPSRIMGRYIIFLPALYLVTAFLPVSLKIKPPLTVKWSYLLRSVILPIALVAISYLILIGEVIIPVKNGLVGAFAAYDVYYIKLLGPWFWLLLLIIYIAPQILLRMGRRKLARRLTALLLIIFYISALPAYFSHITASQYFERLGGDIAAMVRTCGADKNDQYTVYLPDTIEPTQRTDIGWAVRIHNFPAAFAFVAYSPPDFPDIAGSPAIVVQPADANTKLSPQPPYAIDFMGDYTVQLLDAQNACPKD